MYGADPDDDWTDPKVWKKVNPSLGITVPIEKVQDACESAKQNPAEENAFRQLRLCQWVKQSVRWMPMDKWDLCAFPVIPEELEGRVCYGGLDLSSTTDITAFVLVFPPIEEDEPYQILPYFWILGPIPRCGKKLIPPWGLPFQLKKSRTLVNPLSRILLKRMRSGS